MLLPAGNAALTLRSRLKCQIDRADGEDGDGETVTASRAATRGASRGRMPTSLLVLNEVVIDRGPSPYLSNIDLYLDGKLITSVQGDGGYSGGWPNPSTLSVKQSPISF